MPSGCIRERNGRFYIRTRVLVIDQHNGTSRWRQIEKAAGPSRRRAEKMLRALQDDVDDGRFIPSSVTVLELGRRWLAEHVQPNLKAGTVATYKGSFYQHIAPTLGATRLDDLHPQMIRSLLGRKRAEGLGEETVAKIRRHLHAMLAFAQDAGLLSINPADTARARGGQTTHRRARGTQLSPVQIKRFLDECSPRWRAFFIVALDTGLRRGELIGLRWGDIDLLQRILRVRRSIGSYDRPETVGADELSTKTQAGQRLVPILDGAQQALEELYANAKDTSDHAPVFATIECKRGRDGIMRATGRPLSPRMVTRVFRRYAQRAGLAETVRLHDLRHTAITNAIAQGEDILLISAFAGHAKTSTTVDIYGHLMPDRVREAAHRMRSVTGERAAAQLVDRRTFASSVNAPGPYGPGAADREKASAAEAGAADSAEREQESLFVRRVETRSPYRRGRAGAGATVTMRMERATAPPARLIEHARRDHGARVRGAKPSGAAREAAADHTGSRALVAWDTPADGA